MSQGVLTGVFKNPGPHQRQRFQRRTMSDISVTFPCSIHRRAVSRRRQKYLWICLRVTQALRDAGSFRGRLSSGAGDEEPGPWEIEW